MLTDCTQPTKISLAIFIFGIYTMSSWPKQSNDSTDSTVNSSDAAVQGGKGPSGHTIVSTTPALQFLELGEPEDAHTPPLTAIVSSIFHHSLPNELWDQIVQSLDTHDLLTIMKVNRTYHKLIAPHLYRDVTFPNIHDSNERTPLAGLPKGELTGMPCARYSEADSSEIISNYKERLLKFTKVVRLSYGCCASGVPRLINFPNLNTLHKTDMKPCESTDTHQPACHIFEDGGTQPHTLVLHNSSLQSTWNEYRSPTWSPAPWSEVKRIVWCHNKNRKPVCQYNMTQRPRSVQDIKSLETVNLVFPRTHPAVLMDEEQTLTLSFVLAEICASEAQHVVIAGLESLQPSMDDMASAIINDQISKSVSADLSQLIQANVRFCTDGMLMARKRSDLECQHHWRTRVFVPLEDYAAWLNGPDELDHGELGLDKPTAGQEQQMGQISVDSLTIEEGNDPASNESGDDGDSERA